MKKQYAEKEHEHIWMMLGIGMVAIALLGLYYVNKEKIYNLENPEQEVECWEGLEETISDSCVIGCIYSTKFYYNNPNVNFSESSFDCMLNCIDKADTITKTICSEELK